MNTIRAFIAIEIDAPYKQKLSTLISELKKSNADIKWVTDDQLHLTLKFLGNIEENQVSEISNILKSITAHFNGFTITFSKIGAFPNMYKPRVIWLGIDKGSSPLKLLNTKIETELEKLEFEKEKREYKTHLTLGRIKSLKNIPELAKLINQTDFQSQDEIKVDKIILFKSNPTPKGAIYTPLAEHALAVAP